MAYRTRYQGQQPENVHVRQSCNPFVCQSRAARDVGRFSYLIGLGRSNFSASRTIYICREPEQWMSDGGGGGTHWHEAQTLVRCRVYG